MSALVKRQGTWCGRGSMNLFHFGGLRRTIPTDIQTTMWLICKRCPRLHVVIVVTVRKILIVALRRGSFPRKMFNSIFKTPNWIFPRKLNQNRKTDSFLRSSSTNLLTTRQPAFNTLVTFIPSDSVLTLTVSRNTEQCVTVRRAFRQASHLSFPLAP